jgi:putative ABC transport system ATP-binding protein
MRLLREATVQPGRAVIVVTHDSRVYEFGDRIVEMSDGRVTSVQCKRDAESSAALEPSR